MKCDRHKYDDAPAIALERVGQIDWQYDTIREHGMSFSEERFEEGIRGVVGL